MCSYNCIPLAIAREQDKRGFLLLQFSMVFLWPGQCDLSYRKKFILRDSMGNWIDQRVVHMRVLILDCIHLCMCTCTYVLALRTAGGGYDA